MDAAAIEASRRYHRKREERRFKEREELREKRLATVRAAIAEIAPRYPAIERAYLFGSVLQPGRFGPRSDVDVALDCDDVRAETDFWRALEKAIGPDVDVLPRVGPVAKTVELTGKLVYER